MLPICWWFVKKQGIVKEVPARVVDQGCKFHTTEAIDFDEVKKFLKKIEGGEVQAITITGSEGKAQP